jgi:hypothetical protein
VRPWLTLALPAAIVLPIVAGILLGGPLLGFFAAIAVGVAIVATAVRLKPAGQAPPSSSPRERTLARDAASRRFLVPVAVGLAGAVLIATTSGTADTIGWGVLAIALVGAISLAFLEVGYSEDRQRARERRR